MRFPFLTKKKDSKTKEPKKTYYPVCPKCLSPHIKPVREFTSGWLTPTQYYCSNCHYSGLLVLEIDVTLFETKTPQEIKEMFLKDELEILDETEEN